MRYLASSIEREGFEAVIIPFNDSAAAREMVRRIAAWTVSHGTIDTADADRARWRLPEEPGIYQVQLVVDYGDDGLGFDAMVLEVT